MGKIVGITYDLKADYLKKDNDPQDIVAELDSETTLGYIIAALESGGHKVVKIGNASNLLKNLDQLKVDIVFNIAEGLFGRNRESQVPTLLEMKGIPFVGSDALTLGLTLDKILTKKVLIADGLPTPGFMECNDASGIGEKVNLNFPLFAKLRFEGSSKGLNESNFIRNIDELRTQVHRLASTYHQPVLVEEFISGTEFTVAVIGNKEPKVYPVVQVTIDGKLELGNMFYTFERIASSALRYACPAKISDKLQNKMQEIALGVYKSVECRDFGRVDFRVNGQGEPFVLEINPLPSLSMDDIFPIIANLTGIDYNRIVSKILNEALKRYGLE